MFLTPETLWKPTLRFDQYICDTVSIKIGINLAPPSEYWFQFIRMGCVVFLCTYVLLFSSSFACSVVYLLLPVTAVWRVLFFYKLSLCFCASRAMSTDELVYLGILAASIPVGFLLRYLSEYSGRLRHAFKTWIVKCFIFLYINAVIHTSWSL